MELVVMVGALVALDLLALRYGWDSRPQRRQNDL
jgi:hypothetical protein